ncbi:HAMP domain-containing histidine kinase [Actinomadura sp. ATCC 31491]|uniref:histidine kinase n=1 Tax=Actinomadura luzonensis TaxID=2805427 RepID=A0ABT0FQR2_9ACTN|nr:HAMP domain-containing sensor histidine kinase [Actinomadura luzonensis]MCK2214365.1 HAMP domain-containing histidine kinase [Actinomadura luzonensis]
MGGPPRRLLSGVRRTGTGVRHVGAGVRRMGAGVASVRVRATAAATLVVALALGIVALVLVLVLRGSLESSAGAEAARKAVAAVPYAATLSVAPADQLEGPAEQREGPAEPAEALKKAAEPLPGAGDRPPGRPGKEGVVRLQDGRTVTAVDPDVVLTAARDDPGPWAAAGRYAVAGAKVSTASGPGMVWSRVSLEGVGQALRTLYGTLLPGVPAVLLVVAVMTWLAVNRALAPVAAIRAKVAHITARDLHQRVPVPRSRDEIAALATTVNGTLDRLETAVERHKRFVADAAHELRSPIATLRARLELAEPSELTREALADVERLQSLAADLLMLAKLDAGEPLRTAELDLGQVAAEEALRAGRRPDVRVELDVEPDVVLKGSRAHLDRLVTNLVDNAVRHAASTVRVRVRADGEEAVLEVLDDGPGIPFEQREAVFDRFTRLDEARARDAGGAGLGLPIARDIATLHEGTLVYAGGGFVARFPAARCHATL